MILQRCLDKASLPPNHRLQSFELFRSDTVDTDVTEAHTVTKYTQANGALVPMPFFLSNFLIEHEVVVYEKLNLVPAYRQTEIVDSTQFEVFTIGGSGLLFTCVCGIPE